MCRLLICVFNLFNLSGQVVLESLRNNWSASTFILNKIRGGYDEF